MTKAETNIVEVRENTAGKHPLEGLFPSSDGATLAFLILAFVLMPQVLALLGRAMEVISNEGALGLRFFSSLSLFALAGGFVAIGIFRGALFRPLPFRSLLSFGLLLLIVFWILLSVAIHDSSTQMLLRSMAAMIFISSLLFSMPLVLSAQKEPDRFASFFMSGFVTLCCFLILIAFFSRMTGANYNARLGWPATPGVFGYYMLLGWAISYFFMERKALAFVLFLAVFASGSRSAVLILGALFLWAQISRDSCDVRGWACLGGALFLAALGLWLAEPWFFNPYLLKRADILSGRGMLWSQVFKGFEGFSAFFGKGEQAVILAADGRETGAHNAFLSLAKNYGLPFSILALGAWVVRFMPSWQLFAFRAASPLLRLQRAFFIIVSAKSLVSDIFWTNMADAATLFASITLLLPAAEGKKHD